MRILLISFGLLIFSLASFSQDTNTGPTKHFIKKTSVFGNIYAGYYYALNDNTNPKSAFIMPTALLGAKSQLSEKVSTVLIYDVTRTTNFSYTDSSGITNYFEGSKYTAFLKMAQIDWKIKPNITFSVGQLLNEQYLTVQDKWWGHRYVDVTFQEKFRWGMPADFGARLTYKYQKMLSVSITAVNGEGPFRYQDNDGKHLFSTNIQYTPNEKLMVKLYADIQSSAVENSEKRSAISGFAGYKTDKIMGGIEYNMVANSDYSNISDSDLSGISAYGGYHVLDEVEVFGRFDYMISNPNISLTSYTIAGIQYDADKVFHIALNYRNSGGTNEHAIFMSFGASF